jgi:restriction endonuclease S subunit
MKAIPTGFKQTEVGVIPSEWDVKKIGEICAYQNGTSLEHLFNHHDGLKVISIGNYSATGTYVANGVFIALKHRKLVEKFVLRRNDLTMSLNDKTAVGTIIGRVLLIDYDDLYVFNQRTMRLRPKETICPIYLHQVINAERTHGLLVGLAKPGTQIYINTDDVIDLTLPVPPLPEQRAIAATLSDVDALLAKLDQFIAKKRDIKQAAMQQLLTGKKRLPGFSGEWEVAPLQHYVRDFIVPMRDKPKNLSGYIPWCRIEDFNGKYLFESKSAQFVDDQSVREMNLKVYQIGTLLVSCSADLGRCAIVGQPLVSNQTFIGLFLHESRASNEFFYYYMTSKAEELNNLSSGTTISYLSREQFEAFSVKVPKQKEEQTAIAAVLSDMDAELSALESRRDKTRTLKQGMMQELLTGRIRLV